MISETVTIKNKLGLHARSASVFVKTASVFAAKVEVSKSQKRANGKSIMAIMMLEAACGDDLTITVDGTDEHDTMKALVDLIQDRFGEAE